jgi:hypothetical protein
VTDAQLNILLGQKGGDKMIPKLSEYVIKTAIKYHKPVCLTTHSGKVFIGVMKKVDLKECNDITLFRHDNPEKLYASVNYDSIEAIEFVEPDVDETAVPF